MREIHRHSSNKQSFCWAVLTPHMFDLLLEGRSECTPTGVHTARAKQCGYFVFVLRYISLLIYAKVTATRALSPRTIPHTCSESSPSAFVLYFVSLHFTFTKERYLEGICLVKQARGLLWSRRTCCDQSAVTKTGRTTLCLMALPRDAVYCAKPCIAAFTPHSRAALPRRADVGWR